MKNIKVLFISVLCFLTLTGFSLPQSFDMIEDDLIRKEINELLDHRANAIIREDEHSLEIIDNKLEELNVTKFDPYSEDNSINVSDFGLLSNWLPLPSSGLQTWFQHQRTIVFRGITYNVQTFYAQPSSSNTNSALYKNGAGTQTSYPSQPSGHINALKILASTILDQVIDEFAFVVSAFQIALGYANAPTYSTVVSNIVATYTWSSVTTASFIFVKPHGSPQNQWNQKLSSTKSNITIGTMIPTMMFSDGEVVSGIIQHSTTQYYQGRNYDNAYLAMENYYFGRSRSFSYVGNIEIRGVNNVLIGTVTPFRPNHYSELMY